MECALRFKLRHLSVALLSLALAACSAPSQATPTTPPQPTAGATIAPAPTAAPQAAPASAPVAKAAPSPTAAQTARPAATSAGQTAGAVRFELADGSEARY